jgi:hypothetical protein
MATVKHSITFLVSLQKIMREYQTVKKGIMIFEKKTLTRNYQIGFKPIKILGAVMLATVAYS